MNYNIAGLGCAFIPLIMAFCYRARGGAIPLGSTTLARLVFYVAPITLVVAYIAGKHHLPCWIIALSALGAFGGICIGHSQEQGNSVQQFAGMTDIIMVRLVMIFMPLAGFDTSLILPILAGFLTFPACWLGWRIPFNMGRWCKVGDSSTEEFLIGLLPFGVALVAGCLI